MVSESAFFSCLYHPFVERVKEKVMPGWERLLSVREINARLPWLKKIKGELLESS